MGTGREPVPTCKAFLRSVVVLFFVSCVLSVWSRCLLTPVGKLTFSEGSLRLQRFLCPPRQGLNPETSRMATAWLEIYAGILVDRIRRVTRDLIDDEQRGSRKGRGCVD